ncbi:MAG TPA: ABC transporter substrate-binding protein, partial [Propionibacteriaceae bacterium]
MNDNHTRIGHDEVEPSIQTAGSGADWRTTWTPSRRHFISLTGLALGGAALGLGVSACGTAQTGSSAGQAKGRAGAAGETMFVAGFQWGPPKSFNPLAAQPDWPTNVQAGNQSQFIYETLVRFNLLDGSLSPGLAKELQQPDDNTFVLPLQDGTKWSDGSDLTADDVAFTFELGKSAPVTFATLWQYIDSVKATDPRTVEFKVKSKPYNPIIVKNYIASVTIVPKAVFGSISPDKISSETNL